MENPDITAKAAYCLSCPSPRCETLCPTGNHIRDFVKAVKDGDVEEAARILYATNPFPEFTSALCDHARQCRKGCVRGIKGEAVDVPAIESYIALRYGRLYRAPDVKNGKRVACIGAGPANLSAAFFLLEKGYVVDFYEQEDGIGGAILTGIPGFRFDKKALEKVYQDLLDLGANFRFRCRIGKDITLTAIIETYDAVLLAPGASKENWGGQTKVDGYVGGLDFLREANLTGDYSRKFENPFIWGGGNVAMDCARTAKRLFGKASVIYRRSLKEMPANAEEIEAALADGVELLFLHNVKEPIVENGKVVGLNIVTMELGEPDASGRASCHEVPGSESILPCDGLIFAIGEKPDLSAFGPIEAGEGRKTNLPNVWLLGDGRYGAKNIAAAIRDGREAAIEIIEQVR